MYFINVLSGLLEVQLCFTLLAVPFVSAATSRFLQIFLDICLSILGEN